MKTYDLAGIGIGPFNLGLAALADNLQDLDCIFIDKNETFDWHAGLLLPNARMQVPYYADLVTLADPTNRFSYLNYLKSQRRLLSFGIHDNPFPLRIEYNAYCRWVASQLPSLQFGRECINITYDPKETRYVITVWNNRNQQEEIIRARHLVIGVGSTPFLPQHIPDHPLVFHASEYLPKKSDLLQQQRITIVGSGQSAAEMFYDLLHHTGQLTQLHWYTQSRRFYPMDYSKLALEMSTPDYIHHFYHLDPEHKKCTLANQQYLYKGINRDLIDAIYDELYMQRLNKTACDIKLSTHTTLNRVTLMKENRVAHFTHQQSNEFTQIHTDAVILATGYQQNIPGFLAQISNNIRFDEDGKFALHLDYSVDEHHTIFLQNADLHTHGFNSADLGLGPYRNGIILNSILKRTVYEFENNVTFQSFSS
jgi:lysine N6-hydroxylase